jgi:hypothetical protein
VVYVPIGAHDHNFVPSRLLRVLKWGLLFDQTRDLITTSHSPSTVGNILLVVSLSHSFSLIPCISRSGKLLLVLASTVILGSEFRMTHDHNLLFHDSGNRVARISKVRR